MASCITITEDDETGMHSLNLNLRLKETNSTSVFDHVNKQTQESLTLTNQEGLTISRPHSSSGARPKRNKNLVPRKSKSAIALKENGTTAGNDSTGNNSGVVSNVNKACVSKQADTKPFSNHSSPCLRNEIESAQTDIDNLSIEVDAAPMTPLSSRDAFLSERSVLAQSHTMPAGSFPQHTNSAGSFPQQVPTGASTHPTTIPTGARPKSAAIPSGVQPQSSLMFSEILPQTRTVPIKSNNDTMGTQHPSMTMTNLPEPQSTVCPSGAASHSSNSSPRALSQFGSVLDEDMPPSEPLCSGVPVLTSKSQNVGNMENDKQAMFYVPDSTSPPDDSYPDTFTSASAALDIPNSPPMKDILILHDDDDTDEAADYKRHLETEAGLPKDISVDTFSMIDIGKSNFESIQTVPERYRLVFCYLTNTFIDSSYINHLHEMLVTAKLIKNENQHPVPVITSKDTKKSMKFSVSKPLKYHHFLEENGGLKKLYLDSLQRAVAAARDGI